MPALQLVEGIPYTKIVASSSQISIVEPAVDRYKTSFFLDSNSISTLPPGARVVAPNGEIKVVTKEASPPPQPKVTPEIRKASMKLAEASLAVASIVSTLEVIGQRPSPSLIADTIFGILGDAVSLLFMATSGAPLVTLALVGVMMGIKGIWLIANIPSAFEREGQAEVIAVSQKVGKVLGFADPRVYGLNSINQADHVVARSMYSVLYRDVMRLDQKVKLLEFKVEDIQKELERHRSLLSPQIPRIVLPPSQILDNRIEKQGERNFPPQTLNIPPQVNSPSQLVLTQKENIQTPTRVNLPTTPSTIGTPNMLPVTSLSQLILPVMLSIPSAFQLNPPLQKIVERVPQAEKLNCCDELVSDASRSIKFGKPVDLPWVKPMIGFPNLPVLGLLSLLTFAFFAFAKAIDRFEKILVLFI